MRLEKHLALAAYYYASAPLRRMAAAERCVRGAEPVRVLFYHRVADTHPNPWTIGRRAFQRQIEWIVRRYRVVSLAEAQQRLASAGNTEPLACITFDDGYAENCEFAVPLLVRMGAPFTYFVATRHVLDQSPFPHDVARGAPLRPNTVAELRSMRLAGVEIGAHTRNHVDVGAIRDGGLIEDEVLGSVRDVESMIDAPVRYFAFPFGLWQNLSCEAFELLRGAGLAGACSAYGGYNLPGDDPFHIQRFHADPELLRLKNWMTVDPRKLSHTKRFPTTESLAPVPTTAECA